VHMFETRTLPEQMDARAPDGSEVRLLLNIPGRGGMAPFRLHPNEVSKAVTHLTVEEVWYVVGGRGTLWRDSEGTSRCDDLQPGCCVTIPLGTRFQFRAAADSALDIIGVTMPPWPTDREEAVRTKDYWEPNVPA